MIDLSGSFIEDEDKSAFDLHVKASKASSILHLKVRDRDAPSIIAVLQVHFNANSAERTTWLDAFKAATRTETTLVEQMNWLHCCH